MSLLEQMAAQNIRIDLTRYSAFDLMNYVYTLIYFDRASLIRKLGLSIDQADEYGMTVFHCLVLDNCLDGLQRCIDHLAFKHPLNKAGETPLDLVLRITSHSQEDTKSKQREMLMFLFKRDVFRCKKTNKELICELLNFQIIDSDLKNAIEKFESYNQESSHKLEYEKFKKDRQLIEINLDAQPTANISTLRFR